MKKKNFKIYRLTKIFFQCSLRILLSFISYIVKVFKIVSNEVSNILQRSLLLTKCLRTLSHTDWEHKAALRNTVKHIPGIFSPGVDDHGAKKEGRFSSSEVHVSTVSTQICFGARHNKQRKEFGAVGIPGGPDEQLSWHVQHKLERGRHSMQEMLLRSCSYSQLLLTSSSFQLLFSWEWLPAPEPEDSQDAV